MENTLNHGRARCDGEGTAGKVVQTPKPVDEFRAQNRGITGVGSVLGKNSVPRVWLGILRLQQPESTMRKAIKPRIATMESATRG